MKGRSILNLLFCLFIFVFLIVPGGSGEELKSLTLEEVVVTATKTERALEDVPGSVTVITADEMKAKNIRTVDDALKNLSGLFVKRSKGLMDSTTSVRMRGFNGDQYTLVLIDGQPLNDAYTGGVEWGALPVESIERIEVVRGPASALYGGNAMGGVINIITKTPRKLELEAGGGYGSHDAYRYRLSAGDRFWDRLSVRIGYEKEGTDGYPTTPVTRTITSGTGDLSGGYPMNDPYGNPKYWVVGDKGDNGAERRSINGKLRLDYSETGKVTFTAASGQYKYDYGPPHTYMGTFEGSAIVGPNQCAKFQPNNFIDYTGISKNNHDTYSLALEDKLGPVNIYAQAGTVQIDDRYTLESGSGSDDYYSSPGSLVITEKESWFGELRGVIPLWQSHLFTLGTSYRTDEADTNEYNIPFYRSYSGKGSSKYYMGGKSRSWAIFAQDEWQVIDPVRVYVGLRYDWWETYDGASGVPGAERDYESNTESEFSPRVAIVWKLFDYTTLRGSVGHAFRPPTVYELYRTWQSQTTTYQSNPDLKPETVWTYEVGIEQFFFGEKTRLSLTGYRNDIEDLIYYRTEGSTKIKTNAGKARTYGLEFEASQKITDWLTVWANYTYTDAQITDNPVEPKSEDKQITGIPKHTWNGGLDLKYKWLRGSLIARYFSKIYGNSDHSDREEGVYGTYEPALFVDAKISIAPWEHLEFSLSVDNIFDKEYYEYYKTDGRTFFFEVTMKY